jgi:protocatechuate 3,4-dioxygenase beta subunit
MSVPCRGWVEQDQGPYHRDHEPLRQRIAEDRPGAPFDLFIELVHADGKTPVVAAEIEVWHCDALGRYSGFSATDAEPARATTPAPDDRDAPDESFLRGRQVTGIEGVCGFRTIYPGWYPGRTVHIHVIAHVDGRKHTTQLFFPDQLTDAVHARAPYNQHAGRDTDNASDDVYAHEGASTMLDISTAGNTFEGRICLLLPTGA